MAEPKIEVVKIDTIRADDQNANAGTDRGQAMLQSSLRQYGAGRSILLDQKARAMAGNKTLKQAAATGIDEVIVVHTTGNQLVAVQRDDMDLDEPEGRALAYADNRTSEVGLLWDASQVEQDWEAGKLPLDLWTKHELDVMFSPFDDSEPSKLDDVSESLPGAAALKPYIIFESENKYNIPGLLADLISEPPEPIDIWAGRDASDETWEGWWFYNYGSDSMRGLDCERAVLAFYVDDYRFEQWFNEPHRYVAKAINAGFPVIVTPNFSLYHDDPLAYHIWQVYRTRYLGRYMQEAGIPVIPDVDYGREEDLDFCLVGIPEKPHCISMQYNASSGIESQADLHRHSKILERILRELDPESLLLYVGSDKMREMVASVLPEQLHVIWIESRVHRRSRRVMRKVLEV